MISVDSVIAEQFPDVVNRHALLRRPLAAFLRLLFHESEFKWFEQTYPHLRGFDFVEQVLDHFDFQYMVSDRERECIPTSGPVVIIANHPIGSLDGLALLKLVGSIRRDVKAVANELLTAIEPLEDLLLPVVNMGPRTARTAIKAIDQHLGDGGAVVIFPAGEVSRFGPTGIKDGPWRNGFMSFAQRAKAPIVPVYVDARNSAFFYSISMLAKPLSTVLLVNEMFKQAKRHVRIRIGQMVPHETYTNLPLDTRSRVKLFKRHVYKLAKNKRVGALASGTDTVAHPENRTQLRSEIRDCEKLGETADGKQIFLYRYTGDSAVMREMGRLRELSFRAVGEGTGLRRDVDRYDSYYDHIVLWDDNDLELVGAYRLVRAGDAFAVRGDRSLYSQTLFDYSPQALQALRNGVELGRSFVQPRYWGRRSLDYLWYGIGAYLNKYPDIDYLFGPVSISNALPPRAKDLLVAFYSAHFGDWDGWATAKAPYQMQGDNPAVFAGAAYSEEFSALKSQLAEMGVAVPTLYKQYTEVCEPDGVRFAAFNVDADFADCVDGLVIAEVSRIKPSRRKRYQGGV